MYLQLYKEHVGTSEGHGPIHPANQARHRDQQFQGLEEHNDTVDPRTGWRIFPATIPTSSFSSAHWEQYDDWKSNQSWDFFFGDLQPGLSSELFVEKSLNKIYTREPVAEVISTLLFFLVQVVVFRLPETFNSLATDGGVNRYTLAPRHI